VPIQLCAKPVNPTLLWVQMVNAQPRSARYVLKGAAAFLTMEHANLAFPNTSTKSSITNAILAPQDA
jgi:hypothetical protein